MRAGGAGASASAAAASAPADDDDSALSVGTLERAAAEEKLRALFGDTICTALAAPAWKECLETMTLLADQVLQPPGSPACNVSSTARNGCKIGVRALQRYERWSDSMPARDNDIMCLVVWAFGRHHHANLGVFACHSAATYSPRQPRSCGCAGAAAGALAGPCTHSMHGVPAGLGRKEFPGELFHAFCLNGAWHACCCSIVCCNCGQLQCGSWGGSGQLCCQPMLWCGRRSSPRCCSSSPPLHRARPR